MLVSCCGCCSYRRPSSVVLICIVVVALVVIPIVIIVVVVVESSRRRRACCRGAIVGICSYITTNHISLKQELPEIATNNRHISQSAMRFITPTIMDLRPLLFTKCLDAPYTLAYTIQMGTHTRALKESRIHTDVEPRSTQARDIPCGNTAAGARESSGKDSRNCNSARNNGREPRRAKRWRQARKEYCIARHNDTEPSVERSSTETDPLEQRDAKTIGTGKDNNTHTHSKGEKNPARVTRNQLGSWEHTCWRAKCEQDRCIFPASTEQVQGDKENERSDTGGLHSVNVLRWMTFCKSPTVLGHSLSRTFYNLFCCLSMSFVT